MRAAVFFIVIHGSVAGIEYFGDIVAVTVSVPSPVAMQKMLSSATIPPGLDSVYYPGMSASFLFICIDTAA